MFWLLIRRALLVFGLSLYDLVCRPFAAVAHLACATKASLELTAHSVIEDMQFLSLVAYALRFQSRQYYRYGLHVCVVSLCLNGRRFMVITTAC